MVYPKAGNCGFCVDMRIARLRRVRRDPPVEGPSRYNKHVIETAMHCPLMRIVKGDSLAHRLNAASKDTSMVTPMAKYAQALDANGNLDDVCEMLRDRSIKLADVRDMAAVTTVHQAKGFEYDHCAVHSDLLSPGNEDERNISFVAFTRHNSMDTYTSTPIQHLEQPHQTLGTNSQTLDVSRRV